MSSTQYASVSVIDYSKLSTDRVGVAKQVVSGLQGSGFIALKNVPGVDTNKLHKLCEWFFGLGTDTKMSVARNEWNPDSPKYYRGYFPVVPVDSSHKEAFDIGVPLPEDDPEILAGNALYENPLWPSDDHDMKFKDELCAYYDVMHRTSTEIMRSVAIGLGQEEHVFDYMFLEKPLSTLRLLHYPPRKGDIPDVAKTEDGKTLLCGDHSDSVLLTLLITFHYEGLEILDTDDTWKAVKPEPNTLVMNIGDMLAQLTGGRLKATRHRVIDYGKDRFSVPFFLEPNYHADIGSPPLLPESEQMARNMKARLNGGKPLARLNGGKPLKFGHWLVRTYNEKNYIEYKGLLKVLKEF